MNQFIAILKEFYGIKKTTFSESTASFWLVSMKAAGFTAEQSMAALQAYILDPEKSKFLPSPGDLIAQIKGTRADAALEAYAQFGIAEEAAAKVGMYRDVVFDNKATNQAIIAMGGWAPFCNDGSDFKRHVFVKSYEAAVAGFCPEPMLPLKACQDNWNGPKFIGDFEKCHSLLLASGNTKAFEAEKNKLFVESIKVKQLEAAQ